MEFQRRDNFNISKLLPFVSSSSSITSSQPSKLQSNNDDIKNKISKNDKTINDESENNQNQYNKWSFITEYCESSTIHGVRYLGEFDRPKFERYIIMLAYSKNINIYV